MRGKWIPVWILAVFLLYFQPRSVQAEQTGVRPSILAGTWYEADAGKLAAQIRSYLDQAKVVDVPGRLTAIVVPHAGHVYSGRVAAHAFRLLEGRDIETVVLVGPCHRARAEGVSINLKDYETPLGRVQLDRELAESILKIGGEGYGTRPQAHAQEHCLEIQLPFLQTVLPGAKIVPILFDGTDIDVCARLGKTLAQAVEGKKALLLCSTDLSHFHEGDEARAMDGELVKQVEAFDYGGLYMELAMGQIEACGGFSLVSVMMAAKKLKANRASLLNYAHSGDVTGDNSRVVGYMAVAFTNDPDYSPPTVKTDVGVTAEGQKKLLALARQSITTIVENRDFEMPEDLPECARLKRGAFVTLKRYGVLRGCIGNLRADAPLNEVVERMAREAAFSDPRFRPLSKSEMEGLSLEISVLTPFQPVTSVDEIEVGVHGLVMKKGNNSGLLLPQVPVEQGWSREEFLDGTCRKSGLPPGCWKDGVDIYKFSAQVFGEED